MITNILHKTIASSTRKTFATDLQFSLVGDFWKYDVIEKKELNNANE